VAIDIGTGDGRAVLDSARRDPRLLVVGLDAHAGSMAGASRRAARSTKKGGRPNALFVVASAADMPPDLAGLAARVTVIFPWGSLLRGCVGRGAAVAQGICSVLAPGGRLDLILATAERDGLDGIPTAPREVIAAARATFEAHGLSFTDGALLTAMELDAISSTWARRLLREGRDRRAMGIRFASP
jgi:16S rRNA (adenine(1408)-N(1))-methyltransferase